MFGIRTEGCISGINIQNPHKSTQHLLKHSGGKPQILLSRENGQRVFEYSPPSLDGRSTQRDARLGIIYPGDQSIFLLDTQVNAVSDDSGTGDWGIALFALHYTDKETMMGNNDGYYVQL
jgi:hypothetical protein